MAATTMELPFGANPRLTSANGESHELKTMNQGQLTQGQGHTMAIEAYSQGSPGSSSPDPLPETSSAGTGVMHLRDSIMTRSIDSTGSSATNGRLMTMTGTIKRGQKVGDTIEVQLQLSEDELSKLQQSYIEEEKAAQEDEDNACVCGANRGIHIVIFTVLFIPCALLASIVMSFYIGTIAWYNVYLYLSEDRTVWHKVFLCPLLILTFPAFIVLSALCIGIYASIVQISWYCSSWRREVWDFEKGFYGWTCQVLNVPQCAPYQVVILDETCPPGTITPPPEHV